MVASISLESLYGSSLAGSSPDPQRPETHPGRKFLHHWSPVSLNGWKLRHAGQASLRFNLFSDRGLAGHRCGVNGSYRGLYSTWSVCASNLQGSNQVKMGLKVRRCKIHRYCSVMQSTPGRDLFSQVTCIWMSIAGHKCIHSLGLEPRWLNGDATGQFYGLGMVYPRWGLPLYGYKIEPHLKEIMRDPKLEMERGCPISLSIWPLPWHTCPLRASPSDVFAHSFLLSLVHISPLPACRNSHTHRRQSKSVPYSES